MADRESIVIGEIQRLAQEVRGWSSGKIADGERYQMAERLLSNAAQVLLDTAPVANVSPVANEPWIFVSYRRLDQPNLVRQLVSQLEAEFGRESVFCDVDDIPIGTTFGGRIEKALRQAQIVLSVVGPEWCGNPSRIANAGDWIRMETETALGLRKQGTVLIPVLANGGKLPAKEQIPQSLWPLFEVNGRQVNDASFDTDIKLLVADIRQWMEKRWILVTGTGVGTILPKAVESAARQLGQMLARSNFGLVTGGWPGVDLIVAQEFVQTLASLRTDYGDALLQVIPENKKFLFPSGRIERLATEREAWGRTVRRSHAVIVIGGKGGAYDTAQMGLGAGIPVIPLEFTSVEGHDDAKQVWLEMSQASPPILSPEQLAILKTPCVDQLPTLLRALLRDTPGKQG